MSADALSSIAATGGAPAVTTALKRAADATGVDFDVLYNMARRESALDPEAKAKTSSAAGLFQFIDQTWFAMVKKYGARHGLAEEASAITRGAGGKYIVSDPKKRDDILNLRFNPAKAAALAGELVQENKSGLERRLGRAVNEAELYAAHFLGTGGAAKLLSASSTARAADLLPKAAAANHGVFYDGARARSVGEVMASIAKSMGQEAAKAAPKLETKSASFRENLFSAVRSDMHSALVEDADRTERAAAEFDGAPIEKKSLHAMTPLAFAMILQAFDPTRIGARREDSRTQLPQQSLRGL